VLHTYDVADEENQLALPPVAPWARIKSKGPTDNVNVSSIEAALSLVGSRALRHRLAPRAVVGAEL
jgi:hypothetical protein